MSRYLLPMLSCIAMISGCIPTSLHTTPRVDREGEMISLSRGEKLALNVSMTTAADLWRTVQKSLISQPTDEPKGDIPEEQKTWYVAQITDVLKRGLLRVDSTLTFVPAEQATATMDVRLKVKEIRDFTIYQIERDTPMGKRCEANVMTIIDMVMDVTLKKPGRADQKNTASWRGVESPFGIEPFIGNDGCYVKCGTPYFDYCYPKGDRIVDPGPIPFEKVYAAARTKAVDKLSKMTGTLFRVRDEPKPAPAAQSAEEKSAPAAEAEQTTPAAAPAAQPATAPAQQSADDEQP